MTFFENRFKGAYLDSVSESVADILSAIIAPFVLVGSLLMLIGDSLLGLIIRLDETELFDNRAGMVFVMLLSIIPTIILSIGWVISSPAKWLKEVINERLVCCNYV